MAVEINTTDAFWAVVKKSGLLADSEIREHREATKSLYDPVQVAKSLVQGDSLTTWQARQLLAGRYGLRLDKYILLNMTGSCGSSRFYLAKQTSMNRRVVLRVLQHRHSQDKATVAKFQSEARSIAAVDHRNISHILDFDSEGSRHFTVIEYVDGLDLKNIVQQQGVLPPPQVAHYLLQATEGVACAHTQGVVHGGLHPTNMRVDENDTLKILNLGVVQLDGWSNQTVPEYFREYRPPEKQDDSSTPDDKSDIYALGCTAVFMLTGKNPDANVSNGSPEDQLQFLQILCPQLPTNLARIIARMLANQPNDRYVSAHEAVVDLRAWTSQFDHDIGDVSEHDTHQTDPWELLIDDNSPVAAEHSQFAIKTEDQGPTARIHKLRKRKQGTNTADDAEEPFVVKRPSKNIAWYLVGGTAGLLIVTLTVVIWIRRADKLADMNNAPLASAAAEQKDEESFASFEENQLSTTLDPQQTVTNPAARNVETSSPVKPAKSQSGSRLADLPPLTEQDSSQQPKLANDTAETSDQPIKQPSPEKNPVLSKPEPVEPKPETPKPETSEPAEPETTEPTEPETTEPAEEKPASNPSDDNPFGELAEYVELPDFSDSADTENLPDPVVLGTFSISQDDVMVVRLLGQQNAGPGVSFKLSRAKADISVPEWTVQKLSVPQRGNQQIDNPVASNQGTQIGTLVLADDHQLLMQWAASSAGDDKCNFLRNCSLELQLNDHQHLVHFRRPLTVKPISWNFKREQKGRVPLKWLPEPKSLFIEITSIEGDIPKPVFKPAATFQAKEGNTHMWLEAGEQGLVGLKFTATARLLISATPIFQIDKDQINKEPSLYKSGRFKKDLNNLDNRVKQLFKQQTQLERNGEIEDNGKKYKDTDQFKTIKALLDEEKRAKTTDLEYATLVDKLIDSIANVSAKIHFRVFRKIDDKQILLAETDGTPKPHSEGDP